MKEKMLFELEEVLGSRGRVRLLSVLSRFGEVNITKLARLCNLQHTSADRNLQLLLLHDIITEKRFGRIRIYSLNSHSSVARSIQRLFEETRESQEKTFS
ncbi:MAG: hypothetical protein QXX17_03430 [Conexivisphaerales archaeon]